jgi:glycosyltransferase involved in cell wall biosynthesis
MTGQPRVLALSPACNAEAFLRRKLDLMAVQTYPSQRVLIADDASTVATADIAEDYLRRDARFSLVRLANALGWIGNTNAMLEDARGQADWMLFAFHDDVLFPDYVARLAARPDAVLAFSDAEPVFEDQSLQTEAFTRLERATSARARTAIMASMPANWWISAHGMFRAGAAENRWRPEA